MANIRQKKRYGKLSMGIGTASNTMDKQAYEMFSRIRSTAPTLPKPQKPKAPEPSPLDQLIAAENAKEPVDLPKAQQWQNPYIESLTNFFSQITGGLPEAAAFPTAGATVAGTQGGQQAGTGNVPTYTPKAPATNKYWENMTTQILKSIGADSTNQNARTFMLAWMQAENVGAKNYNPLATTQIMSTGVNNFNSAGVQNYLSRQQGIEAVRRTLLNGRYDQIVNGLRKGVNPFVLASSALSQLNTWGTGALVLGVLKTWPAANTPGGGGGGGGTGPGGGGQGTTVGSGGSGGGHTLGQGPAFGPGRE